jgi:hypothetical protein
VVHEAVALISQEADRRGTRLVEELSSSMPAVQGDRVHLVQVLIVLLINAIDAMDGVLPARRRVVVSTNVSDSMVEIAVRDAGPGIPAGDFSRSSIPSSPPRRRAWASGSPSHARSSRPTGPHLGGEHHGRRGHVPIPPGRRAMTRKAGCQVECRDDAERKRREIGVVHVLDDDASVRTALTRLLSAVGYEVSAHANAASYLLQPTADGPSCLILDVRMPEANGLEIQDALARCA